jgi:hypothetical protein
MPPRDDLFADLFTSPDDATPILTRVKKLVLARVPDPDFIDDALGWHVWGEIRWYRSLGWPVAARMADAFSVRFKRYESDPYVSQSGGQPKGRIVDAAPPILWDGPNDDEHFRVSFLFLGSKMFQHELCVELRPEIDWEGTSPPWLPVTRRIRYPESLPGHQFLVPSVGATFLDDIVVINGFY